MQTMPKTFLHYHPLEGIGDNPEVSLREHGIAWLIGKKTPYERAKHDIFYLGSESKDGKYVRFIMVVVSKRGKIIFDPDGYEYGDFNFFRAISHAEALGGVYPCRGSWWKDWRKLRQEVFPRR